MADKKVSFIIDIVGNAKEVLVKIRQGVEDVGKATKSATGLFDKMLDRGMKINQFVEGLERATSAMQEMITPGVSLNAELMQLSAITGESGEALDKIEGYARDLAKEFGVDAATGVRSFSLLLSQLSPELAKTPELLKEMGRNVTVLSKQMGGDTAAAAELLTTAMNQYGVSMDDPEKATAEMAKMMNVMAAAAREGSAEMPQIQEAVKQAGMAAKAAGVSFEETNAAIQLLDKAGKKGAEGGVALRNVLAIMSREDFMPKRVQEALQQAGIDTSVLADKNRSLAERLSALKPILNDSALLSGMFGMENQNAAMALIQNVDEINNLTTAITGTNTAYEQADTIMQSYEEKMNAIRAKIDGVKISLFNATSGLSLWISTLSETLIPLAQLIPLFYTIGIGIKFLVAHWGVLVGAVKIGAIAIGTAIKSIPIIGWVIAVVAAIGGLIAYFWNTSAEFRAVLKGVWAYTTTIFSEIWEVAKNVFSSIADLIKAAFSLDADAMSNAINKLKGGFKDFGSAAGKAYEEAYNAEIKKSKKEEKKKKKSQETTTIEPDPLATVTGLGIAGLGNENKGGGSENKGTTFGGSGGGRGGGAVVNIGNLVGKIELHTVNMKEGVAEIKRIVTQALVEATAEI